MRTVALLSFLMLTAMLAGCTEVVYSCGGGHIRRATFDDFSRSKLNIG